MAACYAITTGEYSDYRVAAVFTTKELAEQELPRYTDAYNDSRIEEFPLDPIVPAAPEGMSGYLCCESAVSDEIFANHCTDVEMAEESRPVGKVEKRDKSKYNVLVWARNKNHAIKIAAEKFAYQRAIDAGIAI
jgi:hypothetical protein